MPSAGHPIICNNPIALVGADLNVKINSEVRRAFDCIGDIQSSSSLFIPVWKLNETLHWCCVSTLHMIWNDFVKHLLTKVNDRSYICHFGFTTLPWKRSVPVCRSLKKNTKGWLTLNWRTCCGSFADLKRFKTTALAAAGSAPSSCTSITAFCITWMKFILS